MTQEKEVHEAIEVILADKQSRTTSLNWATDYCLHSTELCGEALKIQCLYILNNISHWRHPKAKAVRQTLKQFAKQTK